MAYRIVATMKRLTPLTLPALASALLVSCDFFQQPLGGSDEYNPLDVPGGTTTAGAADPYGPAFTPGTFLQTVSPSTSFFLKFPKEDDQPSKILPDYTDVKVISSRGSYVKVEVVDTGDVGFVPSVMLGEKRSPEEIPVTPSATDVPTIPGATQNPDVPPAIAPEPEIPGIEPPQPVDPATPAE